MKPLSSAREVNQSDFEQARLTEQTQYNNSNQQSIKGWGIRAKVIALATIFGVLPVLVVGSVAYRFADNAITKQISSEKIAEAEQLSNQLSRFLQDQLANVQTVARVSGNAIAQVKTHHSKDSFEQQATTKEELEEQLTAFVRDYSMFSHFGIYDLQGQEIVRARSSTKESNQKNLPYFQQALNTGLPAISEPIITNSADHTFSIYMASPVKQREGRTIAIVVAKIPAQFVGSTILGTIGLHKGSGYNIVNSSGQFFQNLNASDRSALGSKIAEEVPRFQQVDAHRKSIAWVDKTKKGKVLQAYAPMKFTPIRKKGELNWSIVTSTDTAIAFAAQKQLLHTIALGTLLTAVVATALAAILAHKAVRPLLVATAAVKKLSQGELDTRIETQGNDELAVLGANINQMAERIQSLLLTQSQNTEQLVHQNQMLTNLARCDGLLEGNTRSAARAFTQGTAETLAVARASLWLYNSNRDGIVCIDLYESNSGQHSEGIELKAVDFPAYFNALEMDRPIVADNAHTDPATQEFWASYLTPLGINSILNAPIRSGGKIVGIVCCEHVGTPRQWQAAEVSFVSSVANLMSLALDSDLLQQEVGHLLEVVSNVEDGDLTIRAAVSDRTTGLVADTFNRLLEQLSQVLTQVLSTARALSAGSTAMGEVAKTVSTNAQDQAQEVAQVQKLTQQVEHSVQGSTLAVNLANQSLLNFQSAVDQGQGALSTMTQGIDVLQQGTNRIVQQMKALGEFLGLADQFVQDQSQIASLTQVLALNATLVAARASEQRDPRKFLAVVREFEAIASQVSNLAQQTNDGLASLQQRTDQIHSVVSAIDLEVQSLGGLVTGFTTGVEQSNHVFGNLKTTTGQVVQAGEAVAQSNQEIFNAAQSTAKAIHEIAQLADRTVLLSRKAQRRSEGMEMLSLRLLDSIGFFRLPDMKLGKLQDTASVQQVALPGTAEHTQSVIDKSSEPNSANDTPVAV
jgi:twitching motility protein PilJ